MATALEIGSVFTRDLVDSTGAVILSAGMPVTAEVLRDHGTRNCLQVFFASEQATPADTALLRPYHPAQIRELNRAFDDTPIVVDVLAASLAQGISVDSAEIDGAVEICLHAVATDPAAALAVSLDIEAVVDHFSPSLRSMRMACLSMVAAELMNCTLAECKAVGRAGLLHDISLPSDRSLLQRQLARAKAGDSFLADYQRHPLRSVDMLKRGLMGISEQELMLVAQVHEQCDGSGFPRGLKKHQLHKLSRLLNIVDAFLSLIDPQHPQGGYVPADALAYLILHTMYGSFDQACIRALISAAAVYPVGSRVVLSDDSTATVIRSTGNDYTRPIVRIDDGSDRILDLRRQGTQIVRPLEMKSMRRLPKSKMDQVLWTGIESD